METKDAVTAFAALAQESRLAVFRLLVKHGPEGLTPGVIAESLGVSPPTLSFHLKALAQAGLLDAALMMSEATLPGEQCWRRLREVSDDQPLPYFSTILVNKQWEYAE